MIKSFLCSVLVLAGLLTLGCGKRTPVVEVSVDQSGVTIEDIADAETADLVWPQWRGGVGGRVVTETSSTDSTSDAVSIPTSWSAESNVRWQADVPGRGHSSPIVVGDLVLIGSSTQEPPEQFVMAYDLNDGSERWKTVVHSGGLPSGRAVHAKATNANSTLASDGTRFVTTHLNGEHIWVTALGLDGEQLWQKDIGAFASRFGYAPSPILYKSLVIVTADNGGGGYLVGMDIRSGEIAWRRSRGNNDSYSSPALVALDGTDQVVITGGNRMASYDPATGDLIWETECISDATCGTAIATGDHVFASGGYPDKETLCLDANGEKVWSNRTKLYEPSLVTDGTNLFGITDDGIAYCWDVVDGTQHWKKRLGGKFSSSPLIINDNVYVSDLSGNDYVFKADADKYELVSKNQLGDDCYASPAFTGDALIYRVGIGKGPQRSEKLFCIAAE
ncbi:PQQ-binding-like beta-propeller repeat protein [Neorhodopirellula lusitana]|uniref:PQQ-binding-like beta-propeller repeat protein n=1 Tax=Neorhodopirellula lusitana TaxID=445327 RepID=UPI0038510FDE